MKYPFFVIEGGDCCGKSTAATMLLDKLAEKGLPFFTIHSLHDHPDGIAAYQAMCRREPIDKVRELMTTAHDVLTKEIVIPQLKEGKVVVQDRNWLSAINYQWINHGLDPFTDELLITGIHRSYGTAKPFVILMDAPDAIVDQRISNKENKDANELESLVFHRNIRLQYRELLSKWLDWGYEGVLIDSSTVDSVSEALDDVLAATLL